jgi:hypothetical protein
VRFLVPFFILIGLGGCSSPKRVADMDWTPAPPPDLGDVVARVGQVPIYGSQVMAEAKRTGKSPRESLEDLVAFNLLAERARRDGLHPAGISEPDVKGALVQRLLERELEPKLRPEAVPDSALRPLYERAKDVFVHPRLVEIGVLSIYTGALMKGEMRQERERNAKDLATFLQEHPAKSLHDFSAVAGDPAWSARNVVYDRFFQGLDRPLSRTIGEEVAKLHAVGETTRQLSDENGLFIARYISERPPEDVTFEQARGKLLAAFHEQWQQQQFLEFTAKLMEAHKVEAYFDRLPPNEQGP